MKNKIKIFSPIAKLVMLFISNPPIKAQDRAQPNQPTIQFSVQISSSVPGQHKDTSAVYVHPVKVTNKDERLVDNAKVAVSVDDVGTLFISWSADVTDSLGNIEHFGPIRSNKISISSSTILQNNKDGKYKIVVTGLTKNGHFITREGSFTLVHIVQPNQPEQTVSNSLLLPKPHVMLKQ